MKYLNNKQSQPQEKMCLILTTPENVTSRELHKDKIYAS